MSRIIERVSLLCSTSTDLSVFLPSVWLTVIEILDPFFFILILVSIRSNSCVFDREENNVIKIVKVESNQRKFSLTVDNGYPRKKKLTDNQ